MNPVTDLPTSLADGSIFRVIVPTSPDPNTNGLKVLVPSVTSAHRSPLSAATVVSNFFAVASAVMVTGFVSAPTELNGPISAGTTFQVPQGITGSVKEATTVLAPVRLAKMSGAPVTPSRKPTSLKASMLIGTVD